VANHQPLLVGQPVLIDVDDQLVDFDAALRGLL